jgi:hypothetical protein
MACCSVCLNRCSDIVVTFFSSVAVYLTHPDEDLVVEAEALMCTDDMPACPLSSHFGEEIYKISADWGTSGLCLHGLK